MSNHDWIIIKNKQQIEWIREAWKYLNELLYLMRDNCKAWVSLIELEILAQEFMDKNNVKWTFKWFEWFPANLILSVNDCVVHWIPDDYILKNWDLLKVDTWVTHNKFVSDSAFSIVIWWEMTNPLAQDLINSTKNALDAWFNAVWPWKFVYDYSKAVYNIVTNDWFNVIKTLTGHWVGIKWHERPYIYNYPHPDTKKIQFVPWMVVCFEPSTAVKSDDVMYKWNNDWNLYCKKWDLWAQWEYMVVITENGIERLSWID